MVGCRREATGQRLTVAEHFGAPSERFAHDVFLRKGKAGVLWRFAQPTQRRTGDWDAAVARAGMHGASLGATAGALAAERSLVVSMDAMGGGNDTGAGAGAGAGAGGGKGTMKKRKADTTASEVCLEAARCECWAC